MPRTTYPYLHGANLGAPLDYFDSPWDNWEKGGTFRPTGNTGVAFDAKGFPQNNPTDYPGNNLMLLFQEATTGGSTLMPIGNYYIKTDPGVTILSGFQCTVNQTGLTGTQVAAGLWKMSIASGNITTWLNIFLGGAAGTGTPMTHLRIRTDAGAGVPASIYLDDPVWRSAFLSAHANFGCVRFMDWMGTSDYYTYPFNAATTGVADIAAAQKPTSWANRATKDGLNWVDGTKRGVPVEVMVNLCNTLACNGWFNLHWYATAAYQASFVQYVHDNMTPGLVAHFEHSNEVWNFQYGNTIWSQESGKAKANASTPGYTAVGTDDFGNTMRDHSDRIAALAAIVNGIYANRPQDKRNVIAFQNGSAFTGTTKAEFNNCYQVCDIYSPAPYFYSFNDMTVDASWAALGDGVRGSVAWYAALKANCKAQIDSRIADVQGHVVYAHSKNLELGTYEGGQHLLNNTYTPEIKVFNASQDMGDLYAYYITALRAIPGIMIQWYNATSVWAGTYGTWGLKQLATDADTPKFTAVNTDAANRTVQTVKRGSRKALTL